MINNLETAIKHCEEVAEYMENKEGYAFTDITYAEYASEQRQFAEWLKELKKLREIPDKLVPRYRDGIPDEYNRGANEMLEEVIHGIRKYMEEVKADEASDNNK